MTATQKIIEKDEPRLVKPEPENQAEAPTLEAIEKQYRQLDELTNFKLVSTWEQWQAGTTTSKEDLYSDLAKIISAASLIRSDITRLKERRERRPDDELLAESATAIRKVTDEMVNEGYDHRDLPRQVERIEESLQALRVVFELCDY